jgi:hypothetical protein
VGTGGSVGSGTAVGGGTSVGSGAGASVAAGAHAARTGVSANNVNSKIPIAFLDIIPPPQVVLNITISLAVAPYLTTHLFSE